MVCRFFKIHGLSIAVALLVAGLAGGTAARAQEVTLLYSGETHAMLYPCNCPIETDGGVSRRATLIKQIRAGTPNVLLVDSGAFFAGGAMDEYSVNISLDEQRTALQLKAMEMMGYDAAAIGDEEFFFGREKLQQAVAQTRIPFLSCNSQDKSFKPFVIRELGGVKIGIIGVTTMLAGQRSGGIAFSDPAESVAASVKELKRQNVNAIVLLSHLGEQEDRQLVKKVAGIDVVVVGNGRAGDEAFVTEAETILLRASWEGRKLGVARLVFKQNKLIEVSTQEKRLSDKIPDDKDMVALLPACFSDKNCSTGARIGICQEPGSPAARCLFPEAIKVPLLIITAQECRTCDTQRAVDSFKRRFPGLSVTTLNYTDKKAARLIKDFGITTLPVYLFGKEVEKDARFSDFKVRLEAKGDYYLLAPQFGGIGYYLNRQQRPGAFDFFISLFDPNAPALLEVLAEFRPEIHFPIQAKDGGFSARKGPAEVEEALRSLCVKKQYPAQYLKYVRCRAKNCESAWWEDCLSDFDPAPVRKCARGALGQELLREHIRMGTELGIADGPAYLLNNQEIFSSARVPRKEEIRKILYGK